MNCGYHRIIGGFPAKQERRVPTIFMECTLTYRSALNTGIQRVVRNVIRHANAVATGYGYAAMPVKIEGNRLVEADILIVLSDKVRPSVAADEKPASIFQRLLWAGKHVLRECMRLTIILLPFDPVRRFLYGPTIRKRVARLLQIPFQLAGIRLPPPERPKVILANPGDILLLLDASWATPGPWSAIRHFKRSGGHVVGVIYDLIPLEYPHDCLPEHVAVFKTWFSKLIRIADAFICISSSIAQQLSKHLSVQYPSHSATITHFYLGSDLCFLANGGDIRQTIKDLFAVPRHVFIVVGSIEPRKNHAFILDEFERFWRAGASASLVLIGRHGWKSEAILDRIANHQELGRQLFLIGDASDTELDYVYRNASALVIASKIEGFRPSDCGSVSTRTTGAMQRYPCLSGDRKRQSSILRAR